MEGKVTFNSYFNLFGSLEAALFSAALFSATHCLYYKLFSELEISCYLRSSSSPSYHPHGKITSCLLDAKYGYAFVSLTGSNVNTHWSHTIFLRYRIRLKMYPSIHLCKPSTSSKRSSPSYFA